MILVQIANKIIWLNPMSHSIVKMTHFVGFFVVSVFGRFFMFIAMVGYKCDILGENVIVCTFHTYSVSMLPATEHLQKV